MTIPKDYPLESFDPRLVAILKRGARGEDFTIQCRSANKATRLQQMLHSYRSRAKKYYGEEQQEMWRPLYLAVVRRVPDERGQKSILHVTSRHNEFSTVLDHLIPETSEPSTDPLAEFEPTNTAKPEGSGG